LQQRIAKHWQVICFLRYGAMEACEASALSASGENIARDAVARRAHEASVHTRRVRFV
jgi:hypothetical protein